MGTTYADQKAAARERGNEDGLARWISASRREAEVEAARGQAEFEASPQGELAAIEAQMAIAGAEMTPQEWAFVHTSQGLPIPPQPREVDLPLALRNELHDRRLAALFRERTQ